MNEVLILSDSHGLTTELQDIQERHDVQAYIHCGDSELSLDSPLLAPYYTVRGNCDWNAPFPEDEVVEIGGLRIFITHGHLYGVKRNVMNLQYRAEELAADIVCFGHSHIAYTEKIGEQLFINPGSIRLPRKIDIPTYAIMRWKTRENITVQYYAVGGKVLEQMRFDIQL